MAVQPAQQTRSGVSGNGVSGARVRRVLALAALLVGCTSTPRPSAPPPPTLAPTAPAPSNPTPPSPAPSPEAGFFFNRDGDDASLAYGPPNSDAVLLFFGCKRGARRVAITDAAETPETGQSLTLASDRAHASLPVRITPDEERGGGVASAVIATDAPVLLSFRKSGKLAFGLSGNPVTLVATPAEMTAIAKFFAVCEQSPHRRFKGRR